MGQDSIGWRRGQDRGKQKWIQDGALDRGRDRIGQRRGSLQKTPPETRHRSFSFTFKRGGSRPSRARERAIRIYHTLLAPHAVSGHSPISLEAGPTLFSLFAVSHDVVFSNKNMAVPLRTQGLRANAASGILGHQSKDRSTTDLFLFFHNPFVARCRREMT